MDHKKLRRILAHLVMSVVGVAIYVACVLVIAWVATPPRVATVTLIVFVLAEWVRYWSSVLSKVHADELNKKPPASMRQGGRPPDCRERGLADVPRWLRRRPRRRPNAPPTP